MRRLRLVTILAVLGIATLVLWSSIYTVSEVEQAIITQFGKPVGAPVATAGLKLKVPFIQDVNLIDKRVLEWDGNPSDMPRVLSVRAMAASTEANNSANSPSSASGGSNAGSIS